MQIYDLKEEIFCNNCGDSCLKQYQLNCPDAVQNYGLLNVSVIGGYVSDYLNDGNQYIFSLCEKCLRGMFENFKVKPKINTCGYNNNITYQEDLNSRKITDWYNNYDAQTAKLKLGICNFTEECQNTGWWRLFNGDLTFNLNCDEHKNERLNHGYRLLLHENLVRTIPLNKEDRNELDKLELANLWAEHFLPHGLGNSLFIRFLPECITDMIPEFDEMEGMSAIWEPGENNLSFVDKMAIEACATIFAEDCIEVLKEFKIKLASGTIYYGPQKRFTKYVREWNIEGRYGTIQTKDDLRSIYED